MRYKNTPRRLSAFIAGFLGFCGEKAQIILFRLGVMEVLMNVDKIKKKTTFSPKTPQNGVENAPSKSILFREMT